MPWLNEIKFDPAQHWLKMGTRTLGDKPWLVADDKAEVELALKAELFEQSSDQVLAVASDSLAPATELLGMVIEALPESSGRPKRYGHEASAEEMHPLEEAARMVQEDLCLLQRRPELGIDTWCLDGAALCFPSRWRLKEKFRQSMAAVHGPVPGYEPTLRSRVDRLLDAVADQGRSVQRRNWFVYSNGALFQPDAPSDSAPLPVGEVLDSMWLRSERQTLRVLPETGWVVFTIRVQQATLSEVVRDPERAVSFARYLAEVDPETMTHRGVNPEQVALISQALCR